MIHTSCLQVSILFIFVSGITIDNKIHPEIFKRKCSVSISFYLLNDHRIHVSCTSFSMLTRLYYLYLCLQSVPVG
ncbi:hypothetical protein C0J52_03582 [Blattella germanica]|nr:hypothetical protein C0J52_03582 [Blattella germanica]